MKYKNPILPGFHPDPSICRVGEAYYIVNSSFEYFPGLPLFYSEDLIHWENIGYCITRKNQLKLKEGTPNCSGLYAPTIRYYKGVYYVICTNVTNGEQDEGNFFVWTTNPRGEWSEPIWIDCPGIDPSLFFDDNGKVYYTGTDEEIFLYEFNIKSGELIGEKRRIWGGSGGNNPEGPHIYKKNNWYYLFISEGGTELCHMITVARSRIIQGPYESCPRNPVLTNRSHALPIRAVGHADITCDQNGNWWAVCLGIRTISYPFRHNLGRETMLVPMVWDEKEWPDMGRNGMLDEYIETNCLPLKLMDKLTKEENIFKSYDYFTEPILKPEWNFIYHSSSELWNIDSQGLSLYGNEVSLSEAKPLSWVGRRQEHHICTAHTCLSFQRESDGEEAGMTIYMNNQHHYEIALLKKDEKNLLILRRQIGSLWKIEHEIIYDEDIVELMIEANLENYIFKYKWKKEFKILGIGETAYLTTEVGGAFTGNYFALYASGNGNRCDNPAKFKWFKYQAKKNDFFTIKT